jgi:hypothetical protein
VFPDPAFLLIVGPVVIFGAAVQGSVGIGLGLVAAPVITLLDPAMMPVAPLVATAVLPLMMIGSEWRHIDLWGMSWALVGRVAGTVGGVVVVATLPIDTLAVVVGAMILVAVAVTIRAVRFRATRRTLTIAGAISGVTGTATSIGGPPIALVYQHDPGPRVRSTLGGFFFTSIVISLLALSLGGQVHSEQVGAGIALVPFVVIGFLISGRLRGRVDGGLFRRLLLTVVAVSGAALLVQPLL